MSGFSQVAPVHPGYVANNWYSPPLTGSVVSGGALASGSVRLVPFYLTKPIRVSDLGCRITTLAAAGNIRLAIYRGDPTTGRPTGTAIVETGNISTAATGPISAAVTAAATLAPGLYFMAANADNATVVLQCLSFTTTNSTMIVGATSLAVVSSAATQTLISYSFASAFGTFPDLTGQTLVEGVLGWGLVFMKAS